MKLSICRADFFNNDIRIEFSASNLLKENKFANYKILLIVGAQRTQLLTN